jgi:hypothetical protein
MLYFTLNVFPASVAGKRFFLAGEMQSMLQSTSHAIAQAL